MKAFSPAADRNRLPIEDVLRKYFPTSGLVWEVASGTGQHVVHFGEVFPQLTWQPSEASESGLRSLRAWTEEAKLPNVLAPLIFDIRDATAPVSSVQAILNCNMIHISAWETCESLFRHAQTVLSADGVLVLYGPFIEADKVTAASNVEFDAYLKSQNADWGIRELDRVTEVAEGRGLRREAVVEMPANNLCVVFRK